jgi:beta-phosphoglucomutase-like phosphatase (HAD superfamily)
VGLLVFCSFHTAGFVPREGDASSPSRARRDVAPFLSMSRPIILQPSPSKELSREELGLPPPLPTPPPEPLRRLSSAKKGSASSSSDTPSLASGKGEQHGYREGSFSGLLGMVSMQPLDVGLPPPLRDLPGGVLPNEQMTVGTRVLADSEVRGLLFDCDGTLLDSMPLFLHSWTAVCPRFGLSMTMDDFYGYAGLPLPDIVRAMHREQLGAEATDAFVDEFLAAKKAAHAQNEASQGHPEPIACVVALARAAEAAGIPVAVATSGLRDHVESHLKHAGLDDLFNSQKGNLVTAADVPRGKPAPDIFIEAARRIGVDPAKCRAYEDGESGLMSAHAAGCHVIDVTQMRGYPSCAGLRRAKAEQGRTRSWLAAKAGVPSAPSRAVAAPPDLDRSKVVLWATLAGIAAAVSVAMVLVRSRSRRVNV